MEENRVPNRCYTVKDLQQILGISRTAVYELLGQKQFRWLLIAGKYRIPRKSFEAWMNGGDGERTGSV